MKDKSLIDSLLYQQLDEYRLEALLGQGGMARVYRGFDVRLKRQVAIKVIASSFRANSEYIARFEREAQAIARLQHPNIVGIYRYGQAHDLLYIAMQYIEGSTLEDLLTLYQAKHQNFLPEEASRLIRPICLALDYAHSHGVIHRDIKPSNIMIDSQGRPILTDFGLVLWEDYRTRGEIFGTPYYIAPEQAISSANAIPQSDLYSVGVIIYEMFTAQLPFQATHPYEVAMLHLTDPPPPPRTIKPELSPELEAVILKALAKEPQERYPTGAALADALDQALGLALDQPVLIQPEPEVETSSSQALDETQPQSETSQEAEATMRQLAGKTLGKYHLVERLGHGGMADVYKAYQPGLARYVAIKVIHSHLADREEFIERFEREAMAVANLRHPNIIQVFDFDREDDRYYMVMEFIDGPTLEAKLIDHRNQGQPFPLNETAVIFKALAEAIGYAHSHGMIHRDLKPSNIMFTPRNRVVLTDFGIARIAGVPSYTMTNEMVGTPAYMSPEQAQGGKVDKRSDIYSLGVILYEMVTGRLPFDGDNPMAVIMQLVNGAWPPPRRIKPELPEAIEQIILKAMSQNPADRYQTAKQMARALQEAIEEVNRASLLPQPAISDNGIQFPPFLHTERAVGARTPPLFVTRERKLEQLDQFLKQALSGQGQVAFIVGGAGRGKTALLTEFARRAQLLYPDLLVAMGNCNAYSGRDDPYRPFREAMTMLTGDVEARLTAGAINLEHARRLWLALLPTCQALLEQGQNLIQLLAPQEELLARLKTAAPYATNELGQLRRLIESDPTATNDLAQESIFQQLTNVWRALAQQRPLLILFDDLQWVDATSLKLLLHLGRRLSGARILVVGAYRPEEVTLGLSGQSHPLEKLLAEFKRMFGDVWVDLGQTGKIENRQFVEMVLDAEPNQLGPAFRQALYQHTGGQPLFTIELLWAMRQRGDLVQNEQGRWVEGASLNWERLPIRLEAVIEERFSRLEEELRPILAVASVEGEEFTVQVTARLQAVNERRLLSQLFHVAARKHRLARDQGEIRVGDQILSRYQFIHILLQRYLYTGLGQAERHLLHGQVGIVLETLYGERAEEIAGQLAHHFQEANMPEKARYYLRQAGEQAARQYAYDEAISYFSRALDLTPQRAQDDRYFLLLAREELYLMAGKHEAQHQDLVSLEQLVEATINYRHQAEVAVRRVRYVEATGDYPASIVAAQLAITLAYVAHDRRSRARGYLQWGRALWRQANYEAARPQLEQALALAQSVHLPQVAADSLNGLGIVSARLGDYAQAKVHSQQALQIYRQLADKQGEGDELNNLGFISYCLGDYLEARAAYDQALLIYRQLGDLRGESVVLTNLALLFHNLGDNQAAYEYNQQALLIVQEIDDSNSRGYAWSHLSRALLGQGIAEPYRVYLTCYQLLRANYSPGAQAVLDTAHRLLQEQAAKISDEALRHSFLERVAVKQENVAEYERQGEEWGVESRK